MYRWPRGEARYLVGQYSILYGFPDDENVIIEPVFMWYDDSSGYSVLVSINPIHHTGRRNRHQTDHRDDGHRMGLPAETDNDRAVMYTFDWPSGKLTNACLLYPTDPTFAARPFQSVYVGRRMYFWSRVPAGLKTGCRSLSAEIVLAPTHVAC